MGRKNSGAAAGHEDGRTTTTTTTRTEGGGGIREVAACNARANEGERKIRDPLIFLLHDMTMIDGVTRVQMVI